MDRDFKTHLTKSFLLFLTLFSSFNLCLFSQSNGIMESSELMTEAVTIPESELRTLYSDIVGQEFCLYIKLPMKYYKDTNEIYPVMFLTDAERSFSITAGIMNILEFPNNIIPDIIIVSIGYKKTDLADWAAGRTRDLTPTNIPELDESTENSLSKATGREFNVKSGGASKFLEFISEELIPFIEKNYRISDSDRGIGGYSYGGLFTLYTLLKRPEIFNLYFAGSPSFSYDNEIIFSYEKEFRESNKQLNAKIFLSAGEKEGEKMINYLNRMTENLKSENYKGLDIRSYIFPEEDHRSCIPSAIMRAFKVLYKK